MWGEWRTCLLVVIGDQGLNCLERFFQICSAAHDAHMRRHRPLKGAANADGFSFGDAFPIDCGSAFGGGCGFFAANLCCGRCKDECF
jgi:hypothetical protein